MKPAYLVLTEGAAELAISSPGMQLTPPYFNTNWSELVDTDLADLSVRIIASRRDTPKPKYALVRTDELELLPQACARDAFSRIGRALKASNRFPIRLPTSWSEYHHGRKFAFFAVPREVGGFRWIAEFDEQEQAVRFLKVTSRDDDVQLKNYDAPPTPRVHSHISALIESSRKSATSETGPSTFVDKFDFDAIGAGAISGTRTLEDWLPFLNNEQRRALELPSSSNIKIIGQAGTGKTLALCMRAVSEARRAEKEGRTTKILFATHSWAMAERVDASLRALNGGIDPAGVVVFPLVQVLQGIIGDATARLMSVLGDDSSDGRVRQLSLINDLLISLSASDRALLTSKGLSEHVQAGLRSDASEQDRGALVEDIYQEINGVISAEGISPEDMEKVNQYLTASRADDLPPFPRRGDRYLALHIYSLFVKRLKDSGYITTDQLVSDSIKVLETYAWNVRREVDGYDLVIADELQLFDAQERMALALLTKTPHQPPFVTAEDPSQGIFSAVAASWRRDISARRPLERVDFTIAHRYDAGVLKLIRHLYYSFPLNATEVDIAKVTDEAADLPRLYHVGTPREAAAKTAELARQTQLAIAKKNRDERVAVVALDGNSDDLEKALSFRDLNVIVIRSTDDIERLLYTKRSVILGSWQYLGGTQFSHVIVCGQSPLAPKSAFGRVRALTSLYVACSRAAKDLTIVFPGILHEALASAVEKKLLLKIDTY